MNTNDNFYLDNEDLQFNMNKMVDWPALLDLRENYAAPDCPYATTSEAVASCKEMLADPIGALAGERIAPRAAAVDREGCRFDNGEVIFPEGLKQNIRDLTAAGLTGVTLDRKYGGLSFSKTFYAAATEIISRADASLMNLFGLQGIGETIQHFGSEELKEKCLPKLASGEWIAAMLLTEADAGSELGAMRTRATLDGKGTWRINGTKRFITFGCGEVLVTLARSEDPTSAPGTKGISLFVVQKGEGVAIRRIEHKLGIHGSPTCEVHFTDAPAALIGERGRGLTRYGAWLMKEARLGVAAQAVGICQAALVAARKYAHEREQFGKKIEEFPQVAQMLTAMQIRTEAARTILFAASQVLDLEEGYNANGGKGNKQVSRLVDILTPLAKYYAAEASIAVTNDAVQVFGGNGFTNEYPVERYLRDARITSIYEGTSQIQVDWAGPRILRGGLAEHLAALASVPLGTDKTWALLREKAQMASSKLAEASAFVNDLGDQAYQDGIARPLVDMACDALVAHEFLRQAAAAGPGSGKSKVAAQFITEMLPRVEMLRQYVMAGKD